MRRLGVPLLVAALALALAGCGERKERVGPGKTEQLQLMLDFLPNADHAGIYAAQAIAASSGFMRTVPFGSRDMQIVPPGRQAQTTPPP